VAMAYERFAAAVRNWLTECHGVAHPLYDFWVQDHLTKVERVRRYYLPILDRHARVMGSSVVDIGCGTGAACVAFSIHGMHAVGVDSSGQMLDLARLRAEEDGAKAVFVQADGLALPFADGEFDLCVCDQVIEHVQEYPILLAEIFRILRPGGLALVSAPHRLALREGHSGLLFASWLPHGTAGRYAVLRGRRGASENWDVWLETPWAIRQKIKRMGFMELWSPWQQSEYRLDERRAIRRILAGIRPIWPLARLVARWKVFLLGTVTFLLIKPLSTTTAKPPGALL
jgi:ubiquinone/menaquinone biosynthesis C-methylase UbiE